MSEDNPWAGRRLLTGSGSSEDFFEGRTMKNRDSINISHSLNGHHRHTHDAIFRHPAAKNLEWHDVRSLLDALANVTEGQNGSLQVTRNGLTVILHAPKHKDVATVEDLLAIRHFLEESEEAAVAPTIAPGLRLLVVIDHREAKIYRTELHGAVPRQLVPYDPHGFGRHLVSENPETDGKRKPERKSFYEAVAATLRGADEILIFGSGTGESSAMDHLVAELKHNHGDVAKHIVGSIVVDAHHVTDDQLLAQARGVLRVKVCVEARRRTRSGDERVRASRVRSSDSFRRDTPCRSGVLNEELAEVQGKAALGMRFAYRRI